MDVNFSTILEGTRQYFQGLPKGSDKDANKTADEMAPPNGNGGPSPETGSPPSAAHPQDPLEPEAHIIHKATVMQQAQRQQAQAALLERPSSANLISPPPHIIRKPQPNNSEESRPRYTPHIPTPPAPARYSPHIPAQPPPTPLYQSRAQPQRTLTVLEARRPSSNNSISSRSYPEEPHQRIAEEASRQVHPSIPKDPQELHPQTRQYEPTPAQAISQDQRHMSSVPNHYLEHRKSSPLTAQHSPAVRSTHPNHSAYPGYPAYPSQGIVDPSSRSSIDHEGHPNNTTRIYPTIQPQAKCANSVKSTNHYQDVAQQAYNHKMHQQAPPPASYQRTRDPYNSQMAQKVPSSLSSQHSARSSKQVSASEYSYSNSRASHHIKTPSSAASTINTMPNYQERVPALDQRQMYSNLQTHTTSSRSSSHSMHPSNMGHNVHPSMIRQPSPMAEHQRVPPIHPHHPPQRISSEYPPHPSSNKHQQIPNPNNHQYNSEQYASHSTSSALSHPVRSYSATKSAAAYSASTKSNSQQQRSVPSKQIPLPHHQQRMTVSVTSIVNEMNVKRQSTMPEASSSTHRSKKESPLDLSVKTVRIPADSTAKDELEAGYDKREGIIRHSSIHSSASREHLPTASQSIRQPSYQDKSNLGASSHKVDFMPNFSAGSSDRNQRYNKEQTYVPNRQSNNPYEQRSYSKAPEPSRSHPVSQPDPGYPQYNNSSYSRRIDSSLPKIDLTISTDDDRESSSHNYVYSKEVGRVREEDSRKRDASHIPNHIPTKVARYESWNIDRHGRILDQQRKEPVNSIPNHYIPNGANLHSQSTQRKPYDYNNSYRKSDVEPHSSKYYAHNVHPNQSRPQSDLYYQHGTQKHPSNNHNYEYSNAQDKAYHGVHEQTQPNNPQYTQNSTPADKRVLSILRNSLGAKHSEIQKTADSDDCIIIQDDSSPPSIDLTEYRPKKSRYPSESKIVSSIPQEIKQSNIAPHKMHVPRAVDSIKYDLEISQQVPAKGGEDSPSAMPIPIKTEATYTVPLSEHNVQVEIDIAARIRTKAELKGFIQPTAVSEGTVTIESQKTVLNDVKIDNVPPQIHRKRLFSRENADEPKKETSVIRNSSESCIFDFPGSDSENEIPVLERRTSTAGKENVSENVTKSNPVEERIVAIKCEKNVDDDPFWTEACDSFLEELQSGKVKKNKQRKILNTHEDDDDEYNDNNNESVQSEEKKDSVIVDVANIKKEQEEFPMVVKIKEEIEETIEEVTYDTDSSDENVPLIQKIKKEKDCIPPTTNNTVNKNERMGLKCPFIKLEKNPKLTSAKATVKITGENTYSLITPQNDEDDKVSSDDERLIVKKRKQEMLKSNKEKSDSSDSDSEVISRLRSRKSLSKSSESAKGMKTPVKDETKSKEEVPTKKPGFGDGSGFGPGWETEVYNYKRSLRMPPSLILISRPPHWPRVSSSLPDLDPCPNSPAPSSSTEELFTHKKYSSNIYGSNEKIKQEMDSDLESLSSYALRKTNYDSEASNSTIVSTASKGAKKKDGSILDVLIQKCGNKELKRKRNKDETLPKIIPKSDNTVELLATPSLGLEKPSNKKGAKNVSKEKVMEDLFYLGSFRKQTISTFRDAFINNTGGVLGATEEFAPVVLKSRTRTETKVLKTRATIKEVFGDERPASAPPVTCTEEERNESTKEVKIKQENKAKEEVKKPEVKVKQEPKPNKEEIKKKVDEKKTKEIPKEKTNKEEPSKVVNKKIKKNIISTVRDGLRSSQLSKRNDSTGRMLRRKKRNNILKALANIKKIKKSDSTKIKKERSSDSPDVESKTIKIKKEPVEGEEPVVKKQFKRLFIRRKHSSGFDYIRKKKKLLKKDDGVLKKRNILPRPSPESVNDIQKEIKNWIIKKSVGETVLHRAARMGYIDCVAYCLEKLDIPPSCRDNAGYTPLHEACSRGHLDIARLLLQYGANVSEAAQGGIRPLHEACENGYTEIVRLLLSYGADPLLCTYSGQSPVSLSTASTLRYLQLHLNDVLGNVPQPWCFNGPCRLLDPVDSGYDPLASPPPSPTPPPPPPQDFICSLAPHPPLYKLRPSSPTQPPDPTLWCLLPDLASILQVKSRDTLLKQVHCGPGVPKDSLKELKMQEFLDRAQCQQFLAAGEKINIRSSKIALVRYTDKVKQLLNIEAVTVR